MRTDQIGCIARSTDCETPVAGISPAQTGWTIMSALDGSWSKFRQAAIRLRSDAGGNVAILFGLSLIPLGGLVGAALDYNRASEMLGFMHKETDAAALAIAASDSPNTEGTLGNLRDRLANHFGSGSGVVTEVGTSGSWEGTAIYTLTTKAKVATTLAAFVPSYPQAISVGVTTTVKRKAPEIKWSMPKIKDLSYEAADYNRVSIYCYNDSKKHEPGKGRRLETLTAIMDNGGTDYSKAKLPECESGETLSYKLWNVRNSRTTPANWQSVGSRNPETDYSLRKSSVEYYGYYTDTTIDINTRIMNNTVTGGRELSNGTTSLTDLTTAPLLETIVCTTGPECVSKSAGGILPNNHETGRIPKTATTGCTEGKSMYFGWEDRPPTSLGSSDRDYDDIRIVVSCPTLEKVGSKEVRIIR